LLQEIKISSFQEVEEEVILAAMLDIIQIESIRSDFWDPPDLEKRGE
jgi:hypothetical protein